MNLTASNAPNPQYLHVPFNKRWECHHATIEKLYINDGLHIETIASKMKDEYGFDASPRQYKYQFRKWGLSKSISSTVKDQIVKAVEKQCTGTVNGQFWYKGKPVDEKNFRRYLWAPCVEPKLSRDAVVPNHRSSAGIDESTSSATSGLISITMRPRSSPSTAPSPINASNSMALDIQGKILHNRAASLLSGHYDDLLGSIPQLTPSNRQLLLEPIGLCRWSIHITEDDLVYDEASSLPAEPFDLCDIDNPDAWPSWPQGPNPPDPVEHLQKALSTNQFSSIGTDILPLSSSKVARAAVQCPGEVLIESVGFAIMARNVELLSGLLAVNLVSDNFQLKKLYPFHLAASYLDGAKSCCGVMRTLILLTRAGNEIKSLFVNDMGHTVLDTLMMHILKAHSSCLPEVVDEQFRGLHQFVGGEIDACGRWDADSPCIRHADSSLRALCHTISDIYGFREAPDIHSRSGLFVRSCGHCGERLEPLPLHTLVLTTFHLASNSCEGETLFGSLACLVCLLDVGADPLMTAEISVKALLRADDGDCCTHEALDPLQLARYVPETVMETWAEGVQLGWKVFLAVLHLAQEKVWPDEEHGNYQDILDCKHPNASDPVSYKPVGDLWASIQT
ncbi:uncharacterized protein PG998_006667 [Apiospora kogelbergensis]|uniref:uncharacterized protein n=1 Tax=Apiospora kogelbergensis TaxID=1337665 RepID=UPI00312E54E7